MKIAVFVLIMVLSSSVLAQVEFGDAKIIQTQSPTPIVEKGWWASLWQDIVEFFVAPTESPVLKVSEHQLQLNENGTVQSITDGKTTKTMSRDMWCWQYSDTQVWCKSTLNCDGDTHNPYTNLDNPGCTMQKYELDDGYFLQHDKGNPEVIARADAQAVIE